VVTDGDEKTVMRFPAAGRRQRAHWAEMRFETLRQVGGVHLSWTKPASNVKLLYLDGETWKPFPEYRQPPPVDPVRRPFRTGLPDIQDVRTLGLRIEFEAPAGSGAELAEWHVGLSGGVQ